MCVYTHMHMPNHTVIHMTYTDITIVAHVRSLRDCVIFRWRESQMLACESVETWSG